MAGRKIGKAGVNSLQACPEKALEFLRRMDDDLRFDRTTLMSAVERELAVPSSIREGRILIEHSEELLDEIIPGRADKSLEYVFNLLAAILPVEPLKAAFRGLQSEDRMLAALGPEFLDSHLSAENVTRLHHQTVTV